MGRTVYHVQRDGKGWALRNISDGRDLGVFDAKDEAVETGRRIAREHQPSQLVVHTADGLVEDDLAYQSDPYALG